MADNHSETTTPKRSTSSRAGALIPLFIGVLFVLCAFLMIGPTLFGATSIFALANGVPDFARTGIIMKGLSTVVGFVFFFLVPGAILVRIGMGLWRGEWQHPIKFKFFATCLFVISSVACGIFLSLLLDPIPYMPPQLYVSLPRMFQMSGEVLNGWLGALAFSGIVSAAAFWAGRKFWNRQRQAPLPA